MPGIGLLRGLTLPHAALGLTVGKDFTQITPHGLGVHPLLVAVAKPLGGRRQRQGVELASSADQLDLAVTRTDRQHHRRERGAQVAADPG